MKSRRSPLDVCIPANVNPVVIVSEAHDQFGIELRPGAWICKTGPVDDGFPVHQGHSKGVAGTGVNAREHPDRVIERTRFFQIALHGKSKLAFRAEISRRNGPIGQGQSLEGLSTIIRKRYFHLAEPHLSVGMGIVPYGPVHQFHGVRNRIYLKVEIYDAVGERPVQA